MLPDGTIPPSLSALPAVCRCCFTAPTFRTFCTLMTGLIAQTRRRTVCGMLLGIGLERVWHHARAHRPFSTARWSIDEVGLSLAQLIVDRLLPARAVLQVAVDDTLFKRSGRKVFGAAWQHDGAARGPRPAGFGPRLRRHPGHHRLDQQRRAHRGTLRGPMGDRDRVPRRPTDPQHRRGPQPHPTRRPTHRPLRTDRPTSW